MNELIFGDNLEVLRSMRSQSIDLIYLDPPFNSNADYNLLYGTRTGGPSRAQSHAFEDTWSWGLDAKRALDETAARHMEAGALLDAFHSAFGDSNMMAYIAMMGVRLIEMERVLKSTGTLYLHCDSTASHYLKVLLDSIFSLQGFRNEIIWRRSNPKSHATQNFPACTDTILRYAKGQATFHPVYEEHDPAYVEKAYKYTDEKGRYRLLPLLNPNDNRPNLTYEFLGVTRVWRWTKERMQRAYEDGVVVQLKPGAVPQYKKYLEDSQGRTVTNCWTDIPQATPSESMGYPTQKPLALLERIIQASSSPGDVVLDPFCGCGTAIEAAQKLGRKWIGIDITYLAIHVIEARLSDRFGQEVMHAYNVLGSPADANDARALAGRDWLEFQKWCVLWLGGLPRTKPGADGGIDGIIRYYEIGRDEPSRAIVSVKGGVNVGVDDVHKLKSVVDRDRAQMGILVCLNPPSAAMRREAASLGEIGTRSRKVPRLQIVTVEMLFEREPVQLPGIVEPPDLRGPIVAPPKGSRRKKSGEQMELLLPLNTEASAPPHKARAIRRETMEVVRPLRAPRRTVR